MWRAGLSALICHEEVLCFVGPPRGGLLIRRFLFRLSKRHGIKGLPRRRIAVPRLCPIL